MSSQVVKSSGPPAAIRSESRGFPDLNRHLEPEQMLKKYSQAISQSSMAWMGVHHLHRAPEQRESLATELAACPSVSELMTIADALAAALQTQPSRKVAQASVAVLFDSRVRGPQNPEIYLEALVYDLYDEGFPPAVIVAACQKLRREQVFTPEIAEVIAACREKMASYRAVQSLAQRLVETRTRVEDALAAMDHQPPQHSTQGERDGSATPSA